MNIVDRWENADLARSVPQAPIVVPSLTGIRFVAAMMVLLGHGCPLLQFGDFLIPSQILGPLAPIGMTVFFVLSGFIMWLNYAPSFRQDLGSAIWGFGVARFARLYPMYACVLVLAAITTPWDSFVAAFPNAFAYLGLIQAWVPTNGSTVMTLSIWSLGHTWSISVEMFLYAIFPAICFGLFRFKSRATFVMLATLMALMLGIAIYFSLFNIPPIAAWFTPLSVGDAYQWIAYHSPFTHVFEFAAGCCAGAAYGGRKLEGGSWIAYLASAGLIASVTLFIFLSDTGAWYQVSVSAVRVLPVLAVCSLLFSLASTDTIIRRFLSSRLMVVGGEVSYSAYLLHGFIYVLFVHPSVEHVSLLGFLGWLAILSGAIATVIVFSYGTYSLIEVPARRWLRQHLSPSPGIGSR